MEYKSITKGLFLKRPNRFIADVQIGSRIERVHVKNTGRCRELLVQGAEVFLEKSDAPGRKTGYDLVAVRKGSRLINMDSTAPNRAVGEWLAAGSFFPRVTEIRPETTYGSSRFDFYIRTGGGDRILIEVKGVTLEREGAALFPDAPSERAVKHVKELMQAKKEGYETCVLFVIQMTGVSYFMPNQETHPAFCQALWEAADCGVRILAYDCEVWESGMRLRKPVEIRRKALLSGRK